MKEKTVKIFKPKVGDILVLNPKSSSIKKYYDADTIKKVEFKVTRACKEFYHTASSMPDFVGNFNYVDYSRDFLMPKIPKTHNHPLTKIFL